MSLGQAMGWPAEIPLEEMLLDIDGHRVLALVPALVDDAPPRLKEGIARRRNLYATGKCPCGARFRPTFDEAGKGQVMPGAVVHADHCPAVSKRINREVRRWLGRPA